MNEIRWYRGEIVDVTRDVPTSRGTVHSPGGNLSKAEPRPASWKSKTMSFLIRNPMLFRLVDEFSSGTKSLHQFCFTSAKKQNHIQLMDQSSPFFVGGPGTVVTRDQYGIASRRRIFDSCFERAGWEELESGQEAPNRALGCPAADRCLQFAPRSGRACANTNDEHNVCCLLWRLNPAGPPSYRLSCRGSSTRKGVRKV